MTREEALNRENWMDSDGWAVAFSEQKIVDSTNSIFEYVDKLKVDLAHHQELAIRTLAILDDEKFFDKTSTDDGWHSALHRDLTKASEGEEFKLFQKLMKRANEIEPLQVEVEKFKDLHKLSVHRHHKADEYIEKLQDKLDLQGGFRKLDKLLIEDLKDKLTKLTIESASRI